MFSHIFLLLFAFFSSCRCVASRFIFLFGLSTQILLKSNNWKSIIVFYVCMHVRCVQTSVLALRKLVNSIRLPLISVYYFIYRNTFIDKVNILKRAIFFGRVRSEVRMRVRILAIMCTHATITDEQGWPTFYNLNSNRLTSVSVFKFFSNCSVPFCLFCRCATATDNNNKKQPQFLYNSILCENTHFECWWFCVALFYCYFHLYFFFKIEKRLVLCCCCCCWAKIVKFAIYCYQ